MWPSFLQRAAFVCQLKNRKRDKRHIHMLVPDWKMSWLAVNKQKKDTTDQLKKLLD